MKRHIGILALVLLAAHVHAQDFPNRAIRLVTSAAGGGGDFTSRMIGSGFGPSLGQQVIVDNRPLVNQGEIVMKAPPDGHTLLVSGSGFWIYPLLRKASYDPVRDFAPITLTDRAPNILAVHPSLPVKSVKDLIELAKARPGELNFGSSAIGSASHLAAELFKAMAGVQMTNVPYKGSSQSLTDLLAGQVQLTISSVAAVAPHIKSGRLKALAVTSLQASALAPGVPTVNATGLPGYEAVSLTGIFAPAKTPPSTIQRLNQEATRVLSQPEVKEKFFQAGLEAVPSSPDELAQIMKAEISRMGKVIREANIHAE